MNLRNSLIAAPMLFVLGTGCSDSSPPPAPNVQVETPAPEKSTKKRQPKEGPGGTGPTGVVP